MQVTKSSSYVEKSVFKSGKAESFIGRTFKTLCKITGKIDKRSRSFTNCNSIHNNNVIKRLAKVCSNNKRNFTDRISHDRKRGRRFIEQWSHNLSTKSRGVSASEHIISIYQNE